MIIGYIIVTIALFVTLYACIFRNSIPTREGFRGRRHPHHRRGYFWDGPQEYLYRFRRRRPFPRRYFWHDMYDDWWEPAPSLSSWWPPINAFWAAPCNCKKGCTPNGCAFPGNGPDDCVWASDCNCCGAL